MISMTLSKTTSDVYIITVEPEPGFSRKFVVRGYNKKACFKNLHSWFLRYYQLRSSSVLASILEMLSAASAAKPDEPYPQGIGIDKMPEILPVIGVQEASKFEKRAADTSIEPKDIQQFVETVTGVTYPEMQVVTKSKSREGRAKKIFIFFLAFYSKMRQGDIGAMFSSKRGRKAHDLVHWHMNTAEKIIQERTDDEFTDWYEKILMLIQKHQQ
jgi:hypothetical protein